MPLLVQLISPARNALLLEESFQAAVPGIMLPYSALAYSSALAVSGELMVTLSFLSTDSPPFDHRHQCTQLLPSPEAWPSAKPPGVFCAFIALVYSRKASSLSGDFEKPAFFDASIREFISAPEQQIGMQINLLPLWPYLTALSTQPPYF